MQLYLESASVEELKEAMGWRVIDGVTTNPALLAAQSGDTVELLGELCEMVPGPVAVAVTSTETSSMIEEGRALAGLHDRILVRVPCLPAGIPAIVALSEERIAVDATLCFSLSQALLAAKAGARMISPSVGGVDQMGQDGLTLVGNTLTMMDQFELKTRVLASDLSTPTHVAESARMGVDAAAIPLPLLRRLVDHPMSAKVHQSWVDTWRKAQN